MVGANNKIGGRKLTIMGMGVSLINLDGRIDLAVEPEAREVSNGTSDQEECRGDDGHVSIVE